MIEIERPKIEIAEISENGTYGKFVVEPLERGFGTTLGNGLRRGAALQPAGRGRKVHQNRRRGPRVFHHSRCKGRRHRDCAEH